MWLFLKIGAAVLGAFMGWRKIIRTGPSPKIFSEYQGITYAETTVIVDKTKIVRCLSLPFPHPLIFGLYFQQENFVFKSQQAPVERAFQSNQKLRELIRNFSYPAYTELSADGAFLYISSSQKGDISKEVPALHAVAQELVSLAPQISALPRKDARLSNAFFHALIYYSFAALAYFIAFMYIDLHVAATPLLVPFAIMTPVFVGTGHFLMKSFVHADYAKRARVVLWALAPVVSIQAVTDLNRLDGHRAKIFSAKIVRSSIEKTGGRKSIPRTKYTIVAQIYPSQEATPVTIKVSKQTFVSVQGLSYIDIAIAPGVFQEPWYSSINGYPVP